MKQKFWLVLFLSGLYLFILPGVSLLNVNAQNTIQIIEQEIDGRFRRTITARLTAEHTKEITAVQFFYHIVGRLTTSRNEVTFNPGKMVQATFRINQAIGLPPGTEIEYWWRLEDIDGGSLKTEPETYLYLDERFDFKTLNNDRLKLYWYSGSRAFGQALFARADQALKRLETDVGVIVEQPIKIFIYGSHRELLNSISPAAREWTGGVAYTEQGVVVVGIHPDDLNWGLRAMTHEITHLVIHQATSNPYGNLPTWLNEGLAVYNEAPDALDPRYDEMLTAATANNALLTLRSLSSGFPRDAEEASLAYGQSGAVVHFMIDTYGPEAMAQLLEIFSEGTVHDRAFTAVLGQDTWGIDNAFRTSLGLPPLPDLPKSREVNKATSSDQKASSIGENTANERKSEASQTDDVPQTKEAQAESDSANGRGLPCLGGLLPLGILGLLITQKTRKTHYQRILGNAEKIVVPKEVSIKAPSQK